VFVFYITLVSMVLWNIRRKTFHREDKPGDCSPEDYSPGVESFDQFLYIAFNNADKARV